MAARPSSRRWCCVTTTPCGRWGACDALKTARKGTGDYWITVQGKAAHAGVEPQKGINAIHELAQQTLSLHALNDYSVGTTVNVGVIRGGSRPNVVPAEA